MEERRPIHVPQEQIEALYRLAQPGEQVNWRARYRSNPSFVQTILPDIYQFLDTNIRQITYDRNNLRALIGLSGGLDSTTTAQLTANMMRQARQEGKVQNTSLILLSFKGMSEEDFIYAQRVAKEIRNQYKDLSIDFYMHNLRPQLRWIDREVDNVIAYSRHNKVYSGELTTRLMALYLMEFADKTGHCLVDSSNLTEIVLGEIVIGAGGECAPLASLYKSQIFDIAEQIGVPDFVLNRAPINSTFGNDKTATYFAEKSLSFSPRDTYKILDLILYSLYERKILPSDVARILKHSPRFIERVSTRIHNQDHRREIPHLVIPDQYNASRLEDFIPRWRTYK